MIVHPEPSEHTGLQNVTSSVGTLVTEIRVTRVAAKAAGGRRPARTPLHRAPCRSNGPRANAMMARPVSPAVRARRALLSGSEAQSPYLQSYDPSRFASIIRVIAHRVVS
jgi:hypothetical protein